MMMGRLILWASVNNWPLNMKMKLSSITRTSCDLLNWDCREEMHISISFLRVNSHIESLYYQIALCHDFYPNACERTSCKDKAISSPRLISAIQVVVFELFYAIINSMLVRWARRDGMLRRAAGYSQLKSTILDIVARLIIGRDGNKTID